MTEQELKQRITPDMIRWMCELAEGFEYREHGGLTFNSLSVYEYGIDTLLPLLLHRAAEGLNKRNEPSNYQVITYTADSVLLTLLSDDFEYDGSDEFFSKDYTPSTLTPGECALLDCMIHVYEEARNG